MTVDSFIHEMDVSLPINELDKYCNGGYTGKGKVFEKKKGRQPKEVGPCQTY